MKRIFPTGTPVEQVLKAVEVMYRSLPQKPFAVTVEVWKKPRTNQQLRPLKRSSTLNKQEFTDYLMFIEAKCVDMGIVIPQPYEGET